MLSTTIHQSLNTGSTNPNLTIVRFQADGDCFDTQCSFIPLPMSAVHGIIVGSNTDEVHFWLNGYVKKQNCLIWSEANPQVYVETPLHPEKLTVWCAL
ncbi:hypothetical protein TNCV_2638611 [Trichonephila clavipes]|nr:hypothetical protein TNCV_2638611 [Trichonephila clavipes]